MIVVCGVAYADFGEADSPTFNLNLLTERGDPSFGYSDSSNFSLNLLGIRRAYGDSDLFPYMYAEASGPPDPTVLQITGIGTLKLADAGHPIDTSKPTIVLTHGWNPCVGGDKPGDMPAWISAMKESIFDKTWSSNWNVVWWDWIEKATSCSPAGPAKQTQWQGNYLGDALMDTLGDNYAQYIHFIGKSLGTSVNRWAADMVHNNGWDSSKTHVTILDAAEIGDLALLVKPVPDEAAFVDTYISAFGDLHEDAVNVILTQGAPIDPTNIVDYIGFHDYPAVWYDKTIVDPITSYMGHWWSFENGGFTGAPPEGSCFAQTASQSDDELDLEQISWGDAVFRMGARTVLQVAQGISVVFSMARTPIKYLGDVILNTLEEKVSAKLKEVVSGSSSLYAMKNSGLDAGESTSSSYLWIPLTIPQGVDLITFDYKFTNCSAGDYVTVSIGDRQVFIMEAKFATNGVYQNSSYIDISGLSGQNVEILVAFNCDDVPGGELDVTNFQFHSTAVPIDLNKDGLVNFLDFAPVSQRWNSADCNESNLWCEHCDFDKSGAIDVNEISTISSNWLRDAGDPNTW
jgi:hypothetical protein